MGKIQIAPPNQEPITLAEAKLHLSVDAALVAEDSLITGLIASARQQAEHRLGRALITQQWRFTMDAFPAFIDLPYPDLQSVQSIKYLDSDGVQQTLAVSEYQVITSGMIGRVQPAYGKRWPSGRVQPEAVWVDYICGYGAPGDVPQSIKAWILMAVATLYGQREGLSAGSLSEVPRNFYEGLLDPYWVPGV